MWYIFIINCKALLIVPVTKVSAKWPYATETKSRIFAKWSRAYFVFFVRSALKHLIIYTNDLIIINAETRNQFSFFILDVSFLGTRK